MFRRKPSKSDRLGWREYQKRLKKPPRRKKKPFQWPAIELKRPRFRLNWPAFGLKQPMSRLDRINLRWTALPMALLAGFLLLTFTGADESPPDTATEEIAETQRHRSRLIEKSDLPIFIGNLSMMNLTDNPVSIDFDGHSYQMHTSLNMELQQYLLKRMDRVNSRYIGIVAMQPDTGCLITMAGFNKIAPDQDPCLLADHPAASLFKVVTAAAGVEEKGYTAQTNFTFNGFKHTLYKRQLTDRKNRYTNAITLKKAFAQSVNPVFGKIGSLYLQKDALDTYGSAFGFNRSIDFELPLAPSRLRVKDDSYHRAEIASGFNRQTTISPVHGAVIVSALLNDGVPVEPTLIASVQDDKGQAVYQTRPRFLPPSVSEKTADVLKELMVATVTSGTARKTFRGRSRNKVLSRLRLGGKTGSIYNRSHDARFDWYIGFAEEKGGSEKLAVSVVVAHEKYIGTRAGQYARMVIERHFKQVFASKKES